MYVLTYRRLFTAGCFLTLGCGGFNPRNFPDTSDLYRESLRRLAAGDGRSAIAGFERLTLELAARDTLLPRSHYYLGRAHATEKEWLLAAQTFARLTSLFPEDTLADDGLVEAGKAYAKIWDDPELDSTYGQSAIAMFAAVGESYPDSPLRDDAERGRATMEAQLAEKDYLVGEHYRRRKSPHSAIVYYDQVIERFPNTRWVAESYARKAQVYKSIGYTEDFAETCSTARERFATHASVREYCGNAPPTAAPVIPPPAVVTPPPPTTGSPLPPRAPPMPGRGDSADSR